MTSNGADLDAMDLQFNSSELDQLVGMVSHAMEGTDDGIMTGNREVMLTHQSVHNPVVENEPFVEITEQPKARGLRFRYECEGRSAGSIPGEHSTPERRTYPTCKIHNYHGPAIIVVSCVTKDVAPNCKPHPHSLVGKDCKKGVCTVKVRDTSVISFPHLGIQCAKKKDVEQSLKLRKEINVDPFQTGFDHPQTSYDLNVVRLCFQVFLPDANGRITRVVTPVVSQPIHDKKSLNELVVCRIDRSSGKARGNDEVFLLCDKVNKDDIQVRFYEENQDDLVWEAFGDFGQGDVHRQYAIVFKTPSYREMFITRPVEVQMQLRRPSDGEVSEPVPFTYMPEDPDPDRIEEKRRRKAERFRSLFDTTGPVVQNPSSVKENLRNKLRANRKIKQESDDSNPLDAGFEFGKYTLNNTGMKQPPSSTVTSAVSASYRTMDNTAMGNMMVLDHPSLQQQQLQQQGFTFSAQVPMGNFPGAQNASLLQTGQVVLSGGDGGLEETTIDLQTLQEYLQDHGNGDVISFPDSLDRVLNVPGCDLGIGAMENIAMDGNPEQNEINMAVSSLPKS